jgi:hypothetical protein
LAANWREFALAGAVVAVAVALFFLWLRRRPEDPDEIERQRRAYLNRVGRIIEGQVLEIVDQPRPASNTGRLNFFRKKDAAMARDGNGTQKLLYYTYSISGVTYETAQDVTGLEERACLERIVSGQPASVKYDPSNPSNSILVADDWSGLH